MKKSRLLATVLGLGLSGLTGASALLAANEAPVPVAKPALPSAALSFVPVPAKPLPPSMQTTGAIPRGPRLAAVNPELKAGLDALSNKNAPQAIAVRDRMAEGLDRHMLTWSIAVSGLRDVPSAEIQRAQRELSDWPGLTLLGTNFERALYRENPPAATVLSALGSTAPATPEGTMLMVRAYAASGKPAEAATALRRLWTKEVLDKPTEDKILAEFSALLSPADHKARMDMLMYKSRIPQAKRFADLGQAPSLYSAWAAVLNRSAKSDALLAAVDARWKSDPGLLFARVENLRRKDKFEEAGSLLAQAPREAALLVNGGEWWNEQRIVARGLADLGKFKAAYQVVARHAASDQTDIVDAEFHAGWYALRGFNDTATAEKHFRRILTASDRPLSQSRAWYWLGRAAEQGGKADANGYFRKAAAYPSTFYGELAAARIKSADFSIPYPQPTDADRQAFATREAVQAIGRYEDAGHGWRAASLYRALAQQLTSPGELALLAAKAEKLGDHQLSLQIGKTAYGRGINVPALAFPVGVIPENANISGSGKALAYAIARQESAFNPAAISPADARGLLQILPGTAKGVASRFGLAYSKEKLTTDAGYNATLGAHYLGEQIDSFGGSYILTFIAYNAGPKRVPEWVARYGDPRGLPLDQVVDWIERIPFPETRNYVQRVMENYQIYKARLGQKTDIAHDLRFGR